MFYKCNHGAHHKMGLVIARGSVCVCVGNSDIDVGSKSPAGHSPGVRRRLGGRLLLVCVARKPERNNEV